MVQNRVLVGEQLLTLVDSLNYKFSSSESFAYYTLAIVNGGDIPVRWKQDIYSSNGLVADPSNGLISPYTSEFITIEFDVKKQLNTSELFYITIVPDTNNEGCFTAIFLIASYTLSDCLAKDYDSEIKCNGLKGKIIYRLKTNSTCYGGLKDISPLNIECRIYMYIFVLASVRNLHGGPVIAHITLTSISVVYLLFYILLFSVYPDRTRELLPLPLIYLFTFGSLLKTISNYFAYLNVDQYVCIIHNFLLTYGLLIEGMYNI